MTQTVISGLGLTTRSRNDHIVDYAPTQFLADAFRQQQYDGIKYRSRVGNGYNLALFDLDPVAIVSRELHHVKALTVISELMQCSQKYW